MFNFVHIYYALVVVYAVLIFMQCFLNQKLFQMIVFNIIIYKTIEAKIISI